MRVIINCANYFEAELIVGRLKNEGILAATLHEHSSTIYPVGNNASVLGVQVVVNDEDYDRAIQLISMDQRPDDETEG